MKLKYLKLGLCIAIAFVLLGYLALPSYEFPLPPSESLISNEPADIETPDRRAYFTNFDRTSVLEHYQNQIITSSHFFLSFLTYRLNYPPEEAQTIIRDQTRSVYLEEIVHPLRESFFVNGFIAQKEKDNIVIDNRLWYEKITVRYVKSNLFNRLLEGILILTSMSLVFGYWGKSLTNFLHIKRT